MNKLKLKYPISPWVVSQGFGENDVPLYKQMGLLGHTGVDVPCKNGTPIYSAHDGIVVFAGQDGAGGNTLIIRTKEKFEYSGQEVFFKSVYCHLKTFKVHANEEVKCGQLVAEGDTTGASTAPHLHFTLKPVAQGEQDWQFENVEQNNGYRGAIDPAPYFTGEYAHKSSYSFTKVMKYGETNNDIKNLQSFLKELGYMPKEVESTGFYGELTRKAVMLMQGNLKVAPFEELYALQGRVCGPKTLNKLNSL